MEKAGLKIFGNSGSENTIETRKTGKKIKRGPGNIIDFLSKVDMFNIFLSFLRKFSFGKFMRK